MRTLIGLIVLLVTFLGGVEPASALTGLTAWSQRYGNTLDDVGYSVATDAAGNVYVAGNFSGTVNFGGINLVSAGDPDIFLAKYNAAGVHQWSQRYGGAGQDGVGSLAVDASGNVIITGDFNGTANFGGVNLVSAGALDAFLAKYNTAGVHQWSQRYGGTGDDRGNSVAVDGAGNVFVAGWFNLTTNFGGVNLVSAGSFDAVLAKYNAAGVHQWSQRYGTTGLENPTGIALDASGNIVIAGYFGATGNLGGANLVSAGQYDIFVAKYDGVGVHQWSQRYGSTNFDAGYGVAVDASSNVLVTGYFFGTVNFGGGNLVGSGTDIFVAKYNPAGAHQWSKRFGSASGDFGTSVATNASSDVFLTGFFLGTVDFGGGNLVSAGGQDIVVAKYNAAGVHQWSRRFGGSGSEIVNDIAVDVSGNAFATGYFETTVNFGTGNLVSAGQQDVFVVKLMRETAEPIISAITDIGNDQGRQVKITFDRSAHDDPVSATPVIHYEAYRRNDAPPALVATTRDVAGMSSRQLMDQGWTQVGTVNGHGKSAYSIDVPTIGDSTIALGAYNSTFFIRGATAGSFTFFDSPIDSGYSLDNLSPGVPSSFAYAAGNLSWDESAAADFDYFTVYGSNIDSFGAATVVDYSVAPAMNVTSSPYTYYYVTATDFSGNEGKPAKINTLSGIGGTPRSYVLSVSNYPNPFNPRTTVSYTIPARGPVTISIYDAHGARVATLFKGERAAGAYSVSWDGRTDDAAVAASGVYFARIEHASGTRTKKMVLLK